MSQTTSPVGLDLVALGRYLLAAGLPVHGELSADLVGGGRSNLTFRVTDGVSRWILRRPPLGDRLPGTHDMAREYRVMAGLAGTAVPVPQVLHLDENGAAFGAPFCLMVEVPGIVIRSREESAALSERHRRQLSEHLVDTLAELHRVDPVEAGLEHLGRAQGYLERQVARWVRQYRAVRVRSLPQVEQIAETLSADVPRNGLTAIIHGDYRLDNVMLDGPDRPSIAAVLDWEMATIGDPLADLATLVMFWDEVDQPFNPISGGLTALPSFYSRAEVLQRYAEVSGTPFDDIDWYLVFVQFRLAVILEQIHARSLEGHLPDGAYDGVEQMVPEILDRAVSDIAVSPSLRSPGGSG